MTDAQGFDVQRLTEELDERLARSDQRLSETYPGGRRSRQPVHTVYVPADQIDVGLLPDYGNQAMMSVVEHGEAFLDLLDGDEDLVDRVLAKLDREPVEDLRIDFEDGYGIRSDEEEDAAAKEAASLLAKWVADRSAPPFHGIRFKSFEEPTRARGLRTLALFVETLSGGAGVPDGFVVTLPKVTSVEQIEAMVLATQRLEEGLGLASRSLQFELQVETPQAILGADGTALVARMIHAADGRCTGLHYGTYDYSASLGIAAVHQSLEHPAADHAKAVLQVAAAGTGVRLSDGSTNLIPTGEADDVRNGWANHLRLVRRSLERGFYQGWDMHPTQLPTRYAATFAFYRSGYEAAGTRLKEYVARSVSQVLDEPATARSLADYLLRGLDCGALEVAEVKQASGQLPSGLRKLAAR